MKIIICETSRPIGLKKKLEKKLNVKISNKKKEIIIGGKPEEEYIAEHVIQAIDFGFPLPAALSIKDEENMFEILDIKKYTKRKDLQKVRARIIGKNGKTLKTLNKLTNCYLELKNNELGIIGSPECIKITQEALMSLIRGAKQKNVYAFLEKNKFKPIFDLGLKSKE